MKTLFSFLWFILSIKRPEVELPLKSPAKTLFYSNLRVLFWGRLHFSSSADQVAKNLKVSHFVSSAMTEITLYALNQVRQCHITPEELEISQTKIILYTKHFRKEMNATNCRIQHQKWHCGHKNHCRIDLTIAGVTSDLVISPEQWLSLEKGKMIYLADQSLGVD